MTSAERQFLISVSGLPGFWARRTGGEVNIDTSESYDGGNRNPEVLSGNVKYTDLVVVRPYKAERDAEILRNARRVAGSWRTSVSETPTDGDLIVTGRPTVWNGLLKHVKGPETNAESATNATVELTFAVSAVA